MASYDVTCSRKDGPDDDQRLEGLGGAGWYHTIDAVIANIDRKGDTYWVDNGKRVQVAVLTHPKTQRQYVTTEPDACGRTTCCSCANAVEPRRYDVT